MFRLRGPDRPMERTPSEINKLKLYGDADDAEVEAAWSQVVIALRTIANEIHAVTSVYAPRISKSTAYCGNTPVKIKERQAYIRGIMAYTSELVNKLVEVTERTYTPGYQIVSSTVIRKTSDAALAHDVAGSVSEYYEGVRMYVELLKEVSYSSIVVMFRCWIK